jgi:UDP-N-acetyl-D-glucosamine 2-epimerase, UDP-hydrolysing
VKKRKITVFTGTRAEYGLMRTMIMLLARNDAVDVQILVSGAHLSPIYGDTLREITRDDFAPVHQVDINLSDNSPVGVCVSMGKAITGYGMMLQKLSPDLMVVLGDRYESFCAVAAASVMNVPVAHIYGGGTTQGAIDEVFRHAMTKMSHLHFVSCEQNRCRVLQMGEAPERVWLVGSTGVENILTLPVLAEREVRKKLSLPEGAPYMVATFHPVTLGGAPAREQIDLLLDALQAQDDLYYVFTGANADAGGQAINDMLRTRATVDPKMRFFMSLGVLLYINAVRYSVGVVGNSSSGVGEVPSLKVPVLDIGDRQKGRERSTAVLHCSPEAKALRDAIARMRTEAALQLARTAKNPLEKPHPSKSIADILARHSLTGILYKKFSQFPS